MNSTIGAVLGAAFAVMAVGAAPANAAGYGKAAFHHGQVVVAAPHGKLVVSKGFDRRGRLVHGRRGVVGGKFANRKFVRHRYAHQRFDRRLDRRFDRRFDRKLDRRFDRKLDRRFDRRFNRGVHAPHRVHRGRSVRRVYRGGRY